MFSMKSVEQSPFEFRRAHRKSTNLRWIETISVVGRLGWLILVFYFAVLFTSFQIHIASRNALLGKYSLVNCNLKNQVHSIALPSQGWQFSGRRSVYLEQLSSSTQSYRCSMSKCTRQNLFPKAVWYPLLKIKCNNYFKSVTFRKASQREIWGLTHRHPWQPWDSFYNYGRRKAHYHVHLWGF